MVIENPAMKREQDWLDVILFVDFFT